MSSKEVKFDCGGRYIEQRVIVLCKVTLRAMTGYFGFFFVSVGGSVSGHFHTSPCVLSIETLQRWNYGRGRGQWKSMFHFLGGGMLEL